MFTHHVRISIECSHHDGHVVHLISRDDTADLMAIAAAAKLRRDGLTVTVTAWREGHHGGVSAPVDITNISEGLDWDDLPF